MVNVNFRFTRPRYERTRRRLLRISDGDTPYIEMPIRMSNIDTPEKAGYAGGPLKAQAKLDRALRRLRDGSFPRVPQAVVNYFAARVLPNAAADHIAAGNQATQVLRDFLERRLVRTGGKRRSVAVFPQGSVLDSYGRLLAYIAPWYTKEELNDGADRTTFNINMIETGWAAFFPFYPTLPRNRDMNFAIRRAEHAWDSKLGVWREYGETFLLAYEYRMLVKLGRENGCMAELHDEAFYRNCIDLQTMQDCGVYGFVDVPPPYRMWVKTDDMAQATIDLGLDRAASSAPSEGP